MQKFSKNSFKKGWNVHEIAKFFPNKPRKKKFHKIFFLAITGIVLCILILLALVMITGGRTPNLHYPITCTLSGGEWLTAHPCRSSNEYKEGKVICTQEMFSPKCQCPLGTKFLDSFCRAEDVMPKAEPLNSDSSYRSNTQDTTLITFTHPSGLYSFQYPPGIVLETTSASNSQEIYFTKTGTGYTTMIENDKSNIFIVIIDFATANSEHNCTYETYTECMYMRLLSEDKPTHANQVVEKSSIGKHKIVKYEQQDKRYENIECHVYLFTNGDNKTITTVQIVSTDEGYKIPESHIQLAEQIISTLIFH